MARKTSRKEEAAVFTRRILVGGIVFAIVFALVIGIAIALSVPRTPNTIMPQVQKEQTVTPMPIETAPPMATRGPLIPGK